MRRRGQITRRGWRIWKLVRCRRCTWGALVAMSRISVDNTQVYSYSSFVCFMCCFRVHLLPSQQVPLGTRKFEAKSQQQFISWCVLDCKYIRKMQWCVLSVHFFLWLKMPSRELSFWPPPLYFWKWLASRHCHVKFTSPSFFLRNKKMVGGIYSPARGSAFFCLILENQLCPSLPGKLGDSSGLAIL